MERPLAGVTAGGYCLRCTHCTSDDERIWCGYYGVWIATPTEGADCPSYEEVA